MRQLLSFSILIIIALSVVHVAQAQQGRSTGPWQTYDTSNGEWRSYAGDIGGKKYSPLDQIDASNFEDLEIAWEWTSVDNRLSRSTPGGGEWSAPLATIVESLVEENPELYRPGRQPLHTPRPSRVSSLTRSTPPKRRWAWRRASRSFMPAAMCFSVFRSK